jgi:hypothetical protein
MSTFFFGSPTVFIERLQVSASEYGLYPPLAILVAGAALLVLPPLLGLMQMLAGVAGVWLTTLITAVAPDSGFQLAMALFVALSMLAFAAARPAAQEMPR